MKVSALIPVYGVEKYIEKCAVSLFGQTYGDIEYIFVDDGTPDSSINVLCEVIERYPERKDNVRIIRHDCNKGLAQARNTALEAATGDYILNVDSDDYLELHAVERLCAVAEKEKADVVVFGYYVVFAKGRLARPNTYQFVDRESYLESLLEKKNALCLWGKFMAHELYLKSGIRGIPGVDQGEDYAVTPRLLYYADRIVMIEDCLYNYVQYNGGAYTKSFKREHIDDLLQADSVLSDFFLSVSGSHSYEDVLFRAKLSTKAYMLRIAHTLSDIQEISKVYTDISLKYYKYLSISNRVILDLVYLKCYRLIFYMARTDSWLRRALKNLLGYSKTNLSIV